MPNTTQATDNDLLIALLKKGRSYLCPSEIKLYDKLLAKKITELNQKLIQ